MERSRFATLVIALVVLGFAALGVLAADAATPSFAAVVNPLNQLPADSIASPSSTLSCVSATSCLASGDYGGAGPFLLHGDPATWEQAGTTLLTGVAWNAITCMSSTFCVAVGGNLTLAGDPATWDASQERTILLGGSFGAGQILSSVACTSPTFCVAVGQDYFTHSQRQPLVLAGDPSMWTAANARQITLGNTRHNGGSLASVSCTSPTYCVAVGYDGHPPQFSGGRTRQPLVLSGNPATWGVAQTKQIPILKSWGGTGMLSSVACPSGTYCVSLGEPQNELGPFKPFVFVGRPNHWTTYSAFRLRQPAATASSLVGGDWAGINASHDLPFLPFTVSCKSTVFCVAVGADRNGGPLYITGNPARWEGGTFARPTRSSPSFLSADLTSASCAPTACFAGGISNGGNFLATLK
jgi:hypothetical protein